MFGPFLCTKVQKGHKGACLFLANITILKVNLVMSGLNIPNHEAHSDYVTKIKCAKLSQCWHFNWIPTANKDMESRKNSDKFCHKSQFTNHLSVLFETLHFHTKMTNSYKIDSFSWLNFQQLILCWIDNILKFIGV